MRKFLEDRLQGGAGGSGSKDEQHDLHLAMATLLMEISRADMHVSDQERAAAADALRRLFDLGPADAEQLVGQAEREAEGAVSLFPFTQLVDHQFSMEQKKDIVELLWSVSLADGELDKYEEHVIRKIADLLHVAHVDFMHAKHKALNRQN